MNQMYHIVVAVQADLFRCYHIICFTLENLTFQFQAQVLRLEFAYERPVFVHLVCLQKGMQCIVAILIQIECRQN